MVHVLVAGSSSSHGFFSYHPTTEHHVLCSKGRRGNAWRQVTTRIFASSNRRGGHSCVYEVHALFRLRTVCHIGCMDLVDDIYRFAFCLPLKFYRRP